MNLEAVMSLIGEWGGTLKYFPSDEDARIGIAKQIAKIACDEQHVEWLVTRIAEIYSDWPGMLEVRAVFCTRYRPTDGVDASLGTSSPAYAAVCGDRADGNPAIHAGRQLAAAVENDASSEAEMAELVRKVGRRLPRMAELPSQAEIDRIKADQECNRKERSA